MCFRCFPHNFLYWKFWRLFQWISLHFHLEQHWDDKRLILQHGRCLLHVIFISPAQMPVLETCPMQHCQKPCRTSTNKQSEFERTISSRNYHKYHISTPKASVFYRSLPTVQRQDNQASMIRTAPCGSRLITCTWKNLGQCSTLELANSPCPCSGSHPWLSLGLVGLWDPLGVRTWSPAPNLGFMNYREIFPFSDLQNATFTPALGAVLLVHFNGHGCILARTLVALASQNWVNLEAS